MATVGRLNGIHSEGTNGISQFSLRGHENSGGHEASAIVCEAAPMGKFLANYRCLPPLWEQKKSDQTSQNAANYYHI
jgi:hypothetical protein